QNLTISDFTSQDCYRTNGESQVFGGDWVSTDFIPCYGSTVKYKGYAFWSASVDLAVVAFFDVCKQMTHYVASSEVLSSMGNDTVSGEVSAQPGDYYVRVISHTSRVLDSYVMVSAGNLYSKLSVVDGLADAVGVSGIEIGYNGFTSDQILLENGTFQSYGEPWRSTDYISCFGAKSVQYTATPFHGNGVNLVAYVAFFDKDKNLISFLDSSSFPFGYHVNQTGSADVPQNAYYVRIVGQDSKCRLSIESTGLEQFTDFKASDLKILCIGDSLTRGVINTDVDIIRESYPYWVGKTLSSYAANAGYPGGVPRTWWARRANYEQPTADTDLVLIMFGTNGELTQNTLATDVGPYTDYADYADTSVGCYCKIIEWIMEQTSNHAQIILMTPPMPWPTTRDESYARGKYNTCLNSLPVIRAIAERYALPVIDVFYGSGMNKYNGSVFRPNDGIHFGAKGYHKLGTFIARQVASMYSTFDVDETGTVIS
ncbi:MAG: SGNH/GDSL hydrolase family protein, partial [Ruminococcus sp.]|nr:SGNH/GDSL hydrolase family protein [Ruminococcus sp.]